MERPVFALSFLQPYAWLSAAGIKTVDIRPRRSGFRGPIYIHASTQKFIRPYDEDWILERLTQEQRDRYYTEPKVEHAIIGQGYMYDCVDTHDSIWSKSGGRHFYLLRDLVLYPKPIPCMGSIAPLFFKPEIIK
jgi:hypothetical protein